MVLLFTFPQYFFAVTGGMMFFAFMFIAINYRNHKKVFINKYKSKKYSAMEIEMKLGSIDSMPEGPEKQDLVKLKKHQQKMFKQWAMALLFIGAVAFIWIYSVGG